MLTLLAFMYGYEDVTTILFDEPDAHMHTNLQREMLGFLKSRSYKKNIQFIIATHSEELIRGVNLISIISVLKTRPERVEAKPQIITALSDVSNLEVTQVKESPFILYIEGDSDERIVRAWAQVLRRKETLKKFHIKSMGGGTKKQMKEQADNHFEGLRQIVPEVKRLMLFDYDTPEESFHPGAEHMTLYEWKRKNIENYLLVEDAWVRTAKKKMGNSLFYPQAKRIINDFFESENLTLPKKTDWKTVDAEIFKVINGKKILFESEKSLFQKLKQLHPGVNFNKEMIAESMLDSEIHEDIEAFFNKLEIIVSK